MIVYENTGVKIEFDPNKKKLTQIWPGYITSNEFKSAISKTVDFVKSNNVLTILSNTLEQKAISPEDSKYAASITPILFQNGIKRMAFVMPKSALTKLSLKNFSEKEKDAEINYFSSLSEANSWLDSL